MTVRPISEDTGQPFGASLHKPVSSICVSSKLDSGAQGYRAEQKTWLQESGADTGGCGCPSFTFTLSSVSHFTILNESGSWEDTSSTDLPRPKAPHLWVLALGTQGTEQPLDAQTQAKLNGNIFKEPQQAENWALRGQQGLITCKQIQSVRNDLRHPPLMGLFLTPPSAPFKAADLLCGAASVGQSHLNCLRSSNPQSSISAPQEEPGSLCVPRKACCWGNIKDISTSRDPAPHCH